MIFVFFHACLQSLRDTGCRYVWARRYCGGKTYYGGFAREASQEPVIPTDAGDHWKMMLQRAPVSGLQ